MSAHLSAAVAVTASGIGQGGCLKLGKFTDRVSFMLVKVQVTYEFVVRGDGPAAATLRASIGIDDARAGDVAVHAVDGDVVERARVAL